MFRDYLNEEFQLRRKRNPSYSLRAFARSIDMNASALGEILKGKRRPSEKLRKKIALSLNWNEVDEKIRDVPQIKSSTDQNFFQMISEWHYFAVLSLTENSDYVPQAEWISKRLNISVQKAQNALVLLKQLGFIDSSGELRIDSPVHSTNTVSDNAIKQNHVEGSLMAADAVMKHDISAREFNATTVAIDLEKLDEYRKILRETVSKVEKLSEKKPSNQVYRLNLQFFPLSHF